jgi:hypothetical protein
MTPFEMKFNTGLKRLVSYRNVNDSRLPSLLHGVSPLCIQTFMFFSVLFKNFKTLNGL